MITKTDAVKNAVQLLKNNNIPDYKISSEYLLAMILNIDVKNLFKVESLTDKEYKKYLKVIKKRCQHEPLDKLLGYVEFCDLNIP